MGLHSDNEKELGHKPVIASFSLGEQRDIFFKHKKINFSVIFIAAINVSSIEVKWKGEVSPPLPKKTISTNYSKKKIEIDIGDELGMFKSGSTVILLFDENVKLLDSLKKGKSVRVGNQIGTHILWFKQYGLHSLGMFPSGQKHLQS